MRLLWDIGMRIALPRPAAAQKIAVLRGSCLPVTAVEQSAAKARIVADAVCKTIEDADLEWIRIDAECSAAACAKDHPAANAVDETVFVTAAQTGAEYKFLENNGAVTTRTDAGKPARETPIVPAPFTDFKRKGKVDVALYPVSEGGALLIGEEFWPCVHQV